MKENNNVKLKISNTNIVLLNIIWINLYFKMKTSEKNTIC